MFTRTRLDDFEVNYNTKFKKIKHLKSKESFAKLAKAVDDNWGTSELQPLIWGKVKFITPIPVNSSKNSELGQSEKLANMMFEGGFIYLSDLLNATPHELIKRCKNLGAFGIEDIAWSIANFDRHEEFVPLFMKDVVPTCEEYKSFIADLGRGHYGKKGRDIIKKGSDEQLENLFEIHLQSLGKGELQWRISRWDE